MALWSAFLARPAKPLPEARPSLTLFFLLAGTFLLTLLPHAIQFPLWVTFSVLVAMGARCILEVYRLPLPSTTFTGAIAVIFLALIYVHFGTWRGREAGTAFTAGLIAIKFYELRRPRDIALILFSCFFVVMTALLFSQVLELFVYCLIMMWVLVALLLRVQMGDLPVDRLLVVLRVSGMILLQAAPLALLLFFFFPRYHGTLGLPLDDTPLGFTDTVQPGSIAKLAHNDAKVMYVHILKGTPLLPESMYWRGVVLWNYKNGAWTQGDGDWVRGHGTQMISSVDPDAANTVEQEITVEAHNQSWLFALDVPMAKPVNMAESAALPNWAGLYVGNVLQLSSGKLDHLTRYDIVSSDLQPLEKLPSWEHNNATTLPNTTIDHLDPRVQDLANSLHQGITAGHEKEYVYAVIRYLRHHGFIYTIEPGEMGTGPEWLANFLFVSKKGFCEHFASAFAVLMRAKGIPARVVVGYLGADFNPYDNSYLVTQDKAHAWDEVWIPLSPNQSENNVQGRWVRFDPTALISTLDTSMSPGQQPKPGESGDIQIVPRQQGFLDRNLPSWAKDYMKQFKMRRDQVETRWDNVVLSYNGETQTRFAQALGLGKKVWLGLCIICAVAIVACLFIFRYWVMHKPPVPPVEKLYTSFCRIMARRGMPRATWEGPLAFTERVADVFPETRREIHRVGLIVSSARYGPVPADEAAIEKLRSMLMIVSASQAASSPRETSLPK